MNEKLRYLPAVHKVQQNNQFKNIAHQVGNERTVTSWLREEMDALRQILLTNEESQLETTQQMEQFVLDQLQKKLEKFRNGNMRRIINATGTILHTNFGRATMSESAIEKIIMAARHYTNLEYNIESGERGSRHSLVEDFIIQSTGAEAAMVVNNNAAAVFFVLKAFAEGKEVIVSRGQLVEIGGSFRISKIMEESGAKLVEVGTTNKTHKYDYEDAISEKTAMVMKVHTSNFKTIGFTAEVSLKELSDVAKNNKSDILVYEDLGSGAIYDFKQHGVGEEPTVKEVLKNGADIVSFSGDKLLGGPQAGIIAGKKSLIDHLKKHQLARVLRVDKMTLAALEETFSTYVKGEHLIKQIPTVQVILESKESITERVRQFIVDLPLRKWEATEMDDVSMIGGGTMPEVSLPTTVLSVNTGPAPAQLVLNKLRTTSNPAIAARLKDGKILFDFRTVSDSESTYIKHELLKLENEFNTDETV
ncbi:L-seryl-tRNA(Sec) selenium transferase [Alteribacillus iranensis]|uniref:L-seryl-tRNA(Sec) selenium transferase n=1 Tax=Alteribacillus iranensis TaxID=930128 RepID=A0A1I2A0G3_9BACI|nr:L-seryl-tRNA(Sec) selenium transferase [Alteribacillus iranensis]SFE37098.1 L-seryl-tRNA(Sec) selenium transferase [Alteribacillus iranensis]